MYIKPNRPTPDPELGGYLSDEGREVERTPYWLRRVRDGDVSAADPPAPPLPAAAAHPQEPADDAGSFVSAPATTRKGT